MQTPLISSGGGCGKLVENRYYAGIFNAQQTTINKA